MADPATPNDAKPQPSEAPRTAPSDASSTGAETAATAPAAPTRKRRSDRRRERRKHRPSRSVDDTQVKKRRDEPVFGLLLILLAALTAMLMTLGVANAPLRPGTTEALVIEHSAENWRRAHQQLRMKQHRQPIEAPNGIAFTSEDDNSVETADTQTKTPSFVFVPHRSEQPEATVPPAVTWLHRWAFDGIGFDTTKTLGFYLGLPPLDPSSTHPDLLAQRARWLSVGLTILGIGLIGWAGFCVGRLVTGAFSLLVAASCPAVLWHGVFATGDAAKLACLALTIATAVWAIRPLRPAPSLVRRILGWMGCGIGLGLSALVGGPLLCVLGFGFVLVPLLLCPGRLNHVVGLLAALCIAALCQVPWLLALFQLGEPLGHAWLKTWVPDQQRLIDSARQAYGLDLVAAIGFIAPWFLWLIAAIGQAASSSSREMRGRVLIGAGWFAVTMLVLGLGTLDQQPSQRVLLAWPAIAVLIAQGFRRFHELSSEGRHARLWLLLRWVYLPLVFAGAFLLGYLCHQPTWLAETAIGPLDPRVARWIKPTHWGYAAACTTMALLVGVITARYIASNHPGRMLAAFAAYLYILMISLVSPITQSPAMLNLPKAKTILHAAYVGDHAVKEREPSAPPAAIDRD